jgi:hypothetical protein
VWLSAASYLGHKNIQHTVRYTEAFVGSIQGLLAIRVAGLFVAWRYPGRQASKEIIMVYTIGYGTRNTPGVSTAQRNTAKEALELAEALERSDEEIKFIDTPTEGRVGMDMLRVFGQRGGRRRLVNQHHLPASHFPTALLSCKDYFLH